MPSPPRATEQAHAPAAPMRWWRRYREARAAGRGIQAPMALLTALLLGGSVLAILFVDQPAALFFHEHRHAWIVHIIDRLQILGESQWYIGGGLLVYVLLRKARPQAAWGGLFVFASVTVTGILVNALKLLFARARPDFPLHENVYGFGYYGLMFAKGSFSYPSGHSVTALAAAAALGFLMPRFRTVCYTLGFLVAFSRAIATAHFVGDVLAGAWLGIAGAVLFSTLMYKDPVR